MVSPVNLICDGRIRRGFGKLLGGLWPRHCLVCGQACGDPGDTHHHDLCPACRQALPWNRSACLRCSLPLPAPAAACGHCQRRPPPLTVALAAFRYEAPLDRLLPAACLRH
jgi:predicted amidophosphoribosyltransferase